MHQSLSVVDPLVIVSFLFLSVFFSFVLLRYHLGGSRRSQVFCFKQQENFFSIVTPGKSGKMSNSLVAAFSAVCFQSCWSLAVGVIVLGEMAGMGVVQRGQNAPLPFLGCMCMCAISRAHSLLMDGSFLSFLSSVRPIS